MTRHYDQRTKVSEMGQDGDVTNGTVSRDGDSRPYNPTNIENCEDPKETKKKSILV